MQGLQPIDYQLAIDSPAIGAGRIIPDNGGIDFFGNQVSATEAPNIGADNGKQITGIFSTELNEKELFQICPNITETYIHLNNTKALQNARVSIASLTGHVIEVKNFSYLMDGETSFDVSNYKPGMYILTLDNGDKRQSKRFIKL